MNVWYELEIQVLESQQAETVVTEGTITDRANFYNDEYFLN